MPTNQEKLDYLSSSAFKRDIFSGQAKEEVDAQTSFIGRIASAVLRAPVQQGDYKSSLWAFVRWLPSGLDNIYGLLVTVRGEIAALREEVKQVAANQGGAIDYDKVKAAVSEAVGELVDNVEETTTKVNLKEGA